MPSSNSWLLYGSNGYTGELIAREAVNRGGRPVLAGRSEEKIRPLAEELDCAWRCFSLEEPAEINAQLDDVCAVLNCAGPFSHTAEPLMDACLSRRLHYLDITGEIDVIEAGFARHQRAATAEVSLMPAVGFDVAPSDCLAAMLAQACPGATHLQLGFAAPAILSPGTSKTVLENLFRARVRRDGRITPVRMAWKVRQIDFPSGRQWAVTIPWGDVASAFHSTGIPNIEVYLALPRSILLLRHLGFALRVLQWKPLRRLILGWIDRHVQGPSESQRNTGGAEFWGQAGTPDGKIAEATMKTPEAYALTVNTALAILERVLSQEIKPGFQTPSTALGAEFITEFDGVEVHWRNKQ